MKCALLILFLVYATSAAADLSDYPMQFIQSGAFNGQIILGSESPSTDALAASEIAVALQQQSSTKITANLDDEFNPLQNAIIIGLPCQNTAMADILGTNVCDIGLNDGEGFLKLIEADVAYLIVSGKTAAEVRKAARFLADYASVTLYGSEMRIGGTLTVPASSPSEILEIKQTEVVEAECTVDDDCREDQSCIATKCLDLGCWEGTVAENHDCVPVPEQPVPEVVEEAPEPELIAEGPEPKVEEEQPKGFFARIIAFILSIFS